MLMVTERLETMVGRSYRNANQGVVVGRSIRLGIADH